jgi:hypothetical protein
MVAEISIVTRLQVFNVRRDPWKLARERPEPGQLRLWPLVDEVAEGDRDRIGNDLDRYGVRPARIGVRA